MNGGPIPGHMGPQLPRAFGWKRLLEGCRSTPEDPRGTALDLCGPPLLHLHFASFQSVEVLRSTFAAMARGAQVRTPALGPTAASPQAPTPAGIRARGAQAPRDAGGAHALPRVRVAPAEGQGQGRGAPNSCPSTRSCARRRDTRLCRDMSWRRGTAPRPLGLQLLCSGESLPYLLRNRVARASPRRPARRQRAARPETPGAPLGTLELVVRAARWATALVYTRARPAQPLQLPTPGVAQRRNPFLLLI